MSVDVATITALTSPEVSEGMAVSIVGLRSRIDQNETEDVIAPRHPPICLVRHGRDVAAHGLSSRRLG